MVKALSCEVFRQKYELVEAALVASCMGGLYIKEDGTLKFIVPEQEGMTTDLYHMGIHFDESDGWVSFYLPA